MDETIKTLEQALRTARAIKRNARQLALDMAFAADESTPPPAQAEVSMQIDSDYERDLSNRGITAVLNGGNGK